jgi:hypothetical protein
MSAMLKQLCDAALLDGEDASRALMSLLTGPDSERRMHDQLQASLWTCGRHMHFVPIHIEQVRRAPVANMPSAIWKVIESIEMD